MCVYNCSFMQWDLLVCLIFSFVLEYWDLKRITSKMFACWKSTDVEPGKLHYDCPVHSAAYSPLWCAEEAKRCTGAVHTAADIQIHAHCTWFYPIFMCATWRNIAFYNVCTCGEWTKAFSTKQSINQVKCDKYCTALHTHTHTLSFQMSCDALV